MFGSRKCVGLVVALLLSVAPTLLLSRAQQNAQPESALALAQRFAYVESSSTSSTVWLANTSGDRSRLFDATHAEGYPIKAQARSDGEFVAFTTLTGANQPAFNGSLVLWEKGEASPTTVDVNVDYAWSPQWDHSGQRILYEKKFPLSSDLGAYRTELWTAMTTGGKTRLYSDSDALEVVPIGWSNDDRSILFHRISSRGDEMFQLAIDSGVSASIVHLADTSAFNVHLSPDGRTAVASIQDGPNSQGYQLLAVKIPEGTTTVIRSGSDSPYSTTWEGQTNRLVVAFGTDSLEYISGKSLTASLPKSDRRLQLRGKGVGVGRIRAVAASPVSNWIVIENSDQLLEVVNDTPKLTIVPIAPHGGRRWVAFAGWVNP